MRPRATRTMTARGALLLLVTGGLVAAWPRAAAPLDLLMEGVNLEAVRVGDWWNTAWQDRRKITFNNAASAENLVSFPVLVALSSANFDYGKLQASGQDLRFVDAGAPPGAAPLPYEIETWNPAGTSYVWVQVPQLDATSTTDHIWMYYNNGSAQDCETDTACPDAVNVWDANFKGVWHLKETAADEGTVAALFKDSTSSANHGDQKGSVNIAGKIGTAQDFDGTNDWIDNGLNVSTLQNVGAATLSAWVYIDTLDANDQYLNDVLRNGGNSSRGTMYISGTSNKFSVGGRAPDTGAFQATSTVATVSTGTWYHLVGVINYATDTHSNYINGVLETTTGTPAYTPTVTDNTTSDGAGLATTGDGFTGNVLDGKLDEARISNVARSADWVEAEYLFTVDSAKYTYGAEESLSYWWNASWRSRRKITFNNAASAENLLNFPVLVSLSAANVDYAKTQNSGQDLRFVDAGAPPGAAPLPYEIETWNPAGTSYVWVQVPQLDATSTTDHIWMYYNNGSAQDCETDTACPDAVNVWDGNFKGVWHLKDGTTLSGVDSTSNANNGTLQNTPAATTGQIDGAASLNGSNQYATLANTASLNITGAITMSAWVKIPNSLLHQSIIGGYQNSIPYVGYGFAVGINPNEHKSNYWSSANGNWVSGNTSVDDNTWRHLAVVVNGTSTTFYVNGVADGTPASQNPGSFAGQRAIGALSDGSGNFYSGTLDEVRISNTNRSADWIEAEYLFTVDSAKYTYGAEESLSYWWNASWRSRRKITFNNAASAENLLNFPVLVSLSAANVDYAKTQNSGQDLRFVDAGAPPGAAPLPYEIETWNPAGTSYVWVQVPQLDATSTTDHIWMYYNNGSAQDCETDTACPNAVNVWDANYKGVWHYKETAACATTFADATSSGNTLSCGSAPTAQASGKIDGARTYDGTDDYTYVTDPANGSLDMGTGPMTVSAWVKFTSLIAAGEIDPIIDKKACGTNNAGYDLRITDSEQVSFRLANGTTQSSVDPANTLSINTWYHLAGTLTRGASDTKTLYLNGAAIGSSDNPAAGWDISGSNDLRVGTCTGTSDTSTDGDIDEVRISNTPRSADWVEAEYLFTVDSAKYAYGAEEAR